MTLNTSDPDLTQCFQTTVITWLPCGFLWLASVFYLPYLYRQETVNTVNSTSPFNVFKTVKYQLFLLKYCNNYAIPAFKPSRIPYLLTVQLHFLFINSSRVYLYSLWKFIKILLLCHTNICEQYILNCQLRHDLNCTCTKSHTKLNLIVILNNIMSNIIT